jgi:hypothetical protein
MSVSTLVLLGLAVVWAVVLLPEAIRKFSGVRGGDSIRSFNHQLSSLQGPGGRQAAASRPSVPGRSNVIDMRSRSQQPAVAVRPMSPAVRRRRQEVLATLGAAAVLTLLCTVAFGGAFVLLHLVADVLLVAYVVMLVQVTNAPAAQPRRADGYAVRSASSGLAGSELGAIGRVTPVNARRIAN